MELGESEAKIVWDIEVQGAEESEQKIEDVRAAAEGLREQVAALKEEPLEVEVGEPEPDRYGVRDAWYRHAHWNGLAIDVTPSGPTQRYWVTWTPPLDEDDVWPTPGSTSEAASTLEEAGMDRPWPKDDPPHIVLADQSMIFP